MTKQLFKKIPVAMRDHLHELTGNELKVWMYLHLHTGKENTAFPSNKTIARATKLTLKTIKKIKASLRRKGWFSKVMQRKRDDGSFSTVVEKTHLPWCKTDTGGEQKGDHGAVVQISHLPTGEEIAPPEVDTVDLEVTPSAIQEPSKYSVLTDGQFVCSSVSSPTPSASDVAEDQHQNLTADQVLEQEPDLVRDLAEDLLRDQALAQRLGIPYFTDDDVPHAVLMAKALLHYNRTPHWLRDMVSWMKRHSFWKKRLHAGRRAVGQLAKHVSTGEIAAQFDQHLTIEVGSGAVEEGSAYWKAWYRDEAKAAAAASGDDYVSAGGDWRDKPDPWCDPPKGFDVEEAE